MKYKVWDNKNKIYIEETENVYVDPGGDLFVIDMKDNDYHVRHLKPERYKIHWYIDDSRQSKEKES